jgi:hypothetical protein
VGDADVSASITFSVEGENMERGTVTAPSGVAFGLASSNNGRHLGAVVTGSSHSLQLRFENGDYVFTTVYGNGLAHFQPTTMSDSFPAFPSINSPQEGDQVSLTPIIEWFRTPQVNLYEIVIVRISCECEEYKIRVGGDASFMALAVPEGILEPGLDYRFEVRALSSEEMKASSTVINVSTFE